jgi:cytochrome oxidase Cu insertion factor (SCO1/SenC/PrrC family)
MTPASRARVASGALAVIIAITASWWALALWPTADAPAWLVLTRETCFGTAATGLPDAGGWMALTGQPLGMLLVLFAGWGRDVKAGLRAAMQRVSGQLAVGTVTAALIASMLGVVVRVHVADARPFATSTTEEVAGQLNRLADVPKPIALVDQTGRTVTLEQFRGRPVIVTFAYAHCETVCPTLVSEVLGARDALATRPPVVLIVTLDPWRDTPSRLPSIAERWGARGDVHVLSGAPDSVERVLNAWRVPRARNERTGDVSHPSVVYVIGPDGRIAYVVDGSQPVIRAAVEAL